MAMMSLRVNQGPSLNLSGIFKNAMNDPDTVMKMELAKSKIWNDYYQNQVYQQQAEEQRQLGIKTGQEAATLKAQQAAKDAAGPAYGQTLADAIHNPDMPIPVDHTPPAAQSLIGPGMPYISSDQKATYDAGMTAAENQRKSQRLLGPAIVQLGKDANDLAQGTGRASGNAILLGNPTPAEARTGATLSTGNLPSTSTVVTAGDTAGTDAAARQAIQEAAGKLPYDAALAQVKAKAEADAKVAARPLGDSELAIYRAKLAELEAKPPGQLTPQDQAILPLLKDAVAKADQTTLGKDQRLVRLAPSATDPTAVETVPGSAPTAPADALGGAFGDLSSLDGVATAVASSVSRKMQDPGYKPTPQEAFDYDAAYAHMYRTPKQSLERDAAGNLNLVSIPPSVPAGALDPSEVYRRAGITPAGGNPAAPVPPPATAGGDVSLGDLTAPVITSTGVTDTGAPGAAVAPVSPTTNPALAKAAADPAIAAAAKLDPRSGVLVQKVVSGTGKPPTEVESNARLFLARSLVAAPFLDAMKTEDIPSVLTTFFADPQDTNLTSAIIRANLDPSTQIFNTARIAFTTAQLRKESGAAINANEFQGADQQYIPQPGNDRAALGYKTELRHAQLRALLDVAYGSDPEGKAAAAAEIAKQGIDLSPHSERMALPPSASQPATGAAPATTGPELPAGIEKPPNWEFYSPEAKQRYILKLSRTPK